MAVITYPILPWTKGKEITMECYGCIGLSGQNIRRRVIRSYQSKLPIGLCKAYL
jgi:hypothetical protein